MVVSFSVMFPFMYERSFFSRIMYEQSFFLSNNSTFSVLYNHACHPVPATHFHEKNLISSVWSHVDVVMHVYVSSIDMYRAFVCFSFGPLCCWCDELVYALDSANSTATGLKRLIAVTTHFLWLYKFGSLVNNHQKIRLTMLHINVTPSILNYKAF